MLSLTSNLTDLKGVGSTIAKRLARLNLFTIGDLLYHFPARYEDFSHFVQIANLKVGERVTIKGKVQLINTRRSWKRRLTVTEALIKDTTGSIKAVWFNQPYLAETIKPGTEVMLAGTLTAGSYGLQLEHPTIEPVAGAHLPVRQAGVHTGRLVPIYPSTGLLGQRLLRTLVNRALPLARSIPDYLPKEIMHKAKLPYLNQAIYSLHFPASTPELTAARRRVTFDELFLIHLRSVLARRSLGNYQARAIPFSEATKELVASLPWALTADQRLATWEIIKDLNKTRPMYRLLQGDVGSGKTIVAGLACFNCLKSNLQAAILAPTEILAEQHWHTLCQLLSPWSIKLALLTRGHHRLSDTAKEVSAAAIKKKLAQGEIELIIGTHALLESNLAWQSLGLVVVDEQHRFGVEHRQALMSGRRPAPHLLSMTATPIPRSLALTLFGDLDISILQHLPPGRQPITTRLVPPSERARAYELMRQEVARDNRVFIVCPLIEESDVLGVRAATAEHERLQRDVFPDLKLGLLHGKMATRAKAHVMEDFKRGATPILVSTSVVEVGVDVPEATVMAIEGAERFGVAQLHQFRGRVGRSERPSACLLMTDSAKPRGLNRLQALVKLSSGFELAEFDLKTRGPGDLLGATQSGFLKLRFAELANAELLKTVREAAALVIKTDPALKRLPQLKAKISQQTFHPE